MKNSLLTALLLTMSAIVVTGQAPLSADKKNIIFLALHVVSIVIRFISMNPDIAPFVR